VRRRGSGGGGVSGGGFLLAVNFFECFERGIRVTKRKIVWEQHELMAVARRAYNIKNDPLFRGTDTEAVRQAQREVLPSELHRPLRSMQEVPRIIGAWREMRQPNNAGEQGANQPSQTPRARPRAVGAESTANLKRELLRRLEDVLDEDRIRRLVREETNRMLEARVPAMILQPEREAT
jgi:hypothetical protein